MKLKLFICLAILWVSACLCSAADSVTYTTGFVVPDNDPNGVSDTENFTSSIQSITDIQISLDITGGFNGDLYAYLRHGNSGFAVLLNRVESTAGNPTGSADSGFHITLSSAASLDVHGGNAGGGALTGTWQPDGRNIDPLNSLDTTPRTALFDSFNGMSASGDWTLFIADSSPVGTATFQDWTLTVTGVPEPSSISLCLVGLGIFAHRAYRNRRRAVLMASVKNHAP
jgi:subtilisin-like proprotein convertase family protein